MPYAATIVADSLSPAGARLTTFQLRFPRFILAQFNTHRAISKNARSSRAVPTRKLIEEVQADPVDPVEWSADRRGMVAGALLSEEETTRVDCAWELARDRAIDSARQLASYGLHKQIVNRVLEPFMWADVVASATSEGWVNFFALRCHRDAQPETRRIARMAAVAYRGSVPTGRGIYDWHLPYVSEADRVAMFPHQMHAASVVRCRRVSYAPFDGEPDTRADELRKHDETQASGHWSPFEHQGRPMFDLAERSGNFVGWRQYRQTLTPNVHTTFDFDSVTEA